MTPAKAGVIIIGNARTLAGTAPDGEVDESKVWRALLESCERVDVGAEGVGSKT